MDDKKIMNENVPYVVHEATLSRLERGNRRMLIALAICVVVMLLNNIAWFVHEEHIANPDKYDKQESVTDNEDESGYDGGYGDEYSDEDYRDGRRESGKGR
ncbi:hypothetical protein [Butyrivibrio sp. M55]|uniref:hypothetical protein n=1 Tax=Butyrivibrio sp. M55 TaxID=1855323 RepID=UPI0008E3F0CB|nr:hypothetical protein [Butyrivibrio sp. M55]SFU37134.1 hypothetical protein SAMN05216540_101342 [Butyrivibrio sp. M55]